MEQKVLIVVSIVSGRNFPQRADCSLVVEAQFNKEILATDPVPHEGSNLPITMELAWELTRKALQQHKLNRTPIKLQCYAVKKNTMVKEQVGYVMLDLRKAHDLTGKEPSWYGLLNSSYSRLKPQLLVNVSLEVEEQQRSQVVMRPSSSKSTDLVLTLDPSGSFYHLGPEGGAQQEMFTLSLTLQNAKQLPPVPSGQSHFYFYYCLLGNDITSEPFVPPDFAAERASIRIKTSRQALSILMATQEDMQVLLCCGSESVGRGCVSLTPLKSVNAMDCTVPLGVGKASIDVTIQLERTSSQELRPPPQEPCPSMQSTSPAEQEESPEVAGQGSARGAEEPQAQPIQQHPSAKRNLTQSFEDASNSTGNSDPNEATPISSGCTHSEHPIAASTAHVLGAPLTSVLHPPQASAVSNPADSAPPPRPLPVIPATTSDSRFSLPAPSLAYSDDPRQQQPVASRAASLGSVAPRPQVSVTEQPSVDRIFSPSARSQPAVPPPSGPTHAPGGVVYPLSNQADAAHLTSEHRHYRFSIDLRTLHNSSMEPGIKCYLRYHYPFFGCPYPVLVQPPVTLAGPDSEHRFTQSFCSFDFASSYQQLLHHTSRQPLKVEVWQSCDQSHDEMVGMSRVPLAPVLSQEKAVLDGGKLVRQIFSMQSHVTPPSGPSHLVDDLSSLGKLSVVLILEDLGPINLADGLKLKTKGKPSVSDNMTDAPNHAHNHLTEQASDHVISASSTASGHVTSAPSHGTGLATSAPSHAAKKLSTNGITASSEYAVAMELEMWKMAEEEAFKEELHSREVSHMTQLGEEWRRRETQRQQLLRQKLEHYTSLEKQLQEGLDKLQTQQNLLQERERKVSQERERLKIEQASLKATHSHEVTNLKLKYDQHLELERLKASEYQHQISLLKQQLKDQNTKLHSREAEFEKYRQEVTMRPESKLQAELSIAILEKAELERKVVSLTKSKQHYKDQWSKALSELATSRQREQAVTRNRLLTQQQELEALRVQYFQQEQQNSWKQQLTDVKKDVDSLQEKTLNPRLPTTPPASPTRPITPPRKSSGTPPLLPHPLPRPQSPALERDSTLNADIARWIEERDILLQTGVYAGTDPTIQRLDSKIRLAMAQLKLHS